MGEIASYQVIWPVEDGNERANNSSYWYFELVILKVYLAGMIVDNVVWQDSALS